MKTEEKQADIEFACDGKCRICPYPGAHCKTITVLPALPVREEDRHRTWMDPELQAQIRKKYRIG